MSETGPEPTSSVRSRRRSRAVPSATTAKTAEQGKLPVRERVERLVDPESFAEEGLLANWDAEGLGADGVVTGLALIGGRQVCLMANDPTVKAGSWGPKTVEKILRIQERALKLELPMIYLVDSAGARITDQVQMFPGRRGAGRIFYNEVGLSGRVPQVCLLFGPSAAGGAYIPAFCDVVIMREGNASMYLGSPRMAEMVIGEKVTLEEMGGAKMHTGVSGCGHFLVETDDEAIDLAKRYLSYMPTSWREPPPAAPPGEPESERSVSEIVPADEKTAFDVKELIAALIDADSFCEVHARWAKELVVGYARLDGRAIGIVANQPKYKGGVLFVDSADKAARFIMTCNAFNLPLLFLADVPGFMIGTDGRAPGDHPPRREDDQRRLRGDGAEALGDRPQGLRRRPLRDGRPGVRARLLHRAADRVDRGDGPRGGDQRRLLQPDPGDRRRGRARAVRRREARRVLGRHRHPAPRLRDGGRRGDRARRPARRADPPLRARRVEGPRLLASGATRSRRPRAS